MSPHETTFDAGRLSGILPDQYDAWNVEPVSARRIENRPFVQAGTFRENVGPKLGANGQDLADQSDELKKTDKSDSHAKGYRDVIVKRLIVSVLLIVFGFFFALYGPYNERGFQSPAFVIGVCAAAVGFGLMCSGLFPATYGWLL